MTTYPLPRRVHIGTRAEIDTPGGLHGVIKGLSAAQARLGMRVEIVHNIANATTYDTLEVPAEQPPATRTPEAHPAAPMVLREYHFAQTASALLPRRDRRTETPAVFHFHGPWASESRVQGQSALRALAKFVVEWRTYHRFTAFTAHSTAFRRVLLDRFRIPAERVALVHPGVDTASFTPQDKQTARAALGLPADAFVVGSLRRLVHRMGLDVLLRAAVGHRDVVVAIAGAGPQDADLRRLADDLGIAHRVRFLGRLDQPRVPTFYSALDCSVIPSRALEGFGLVALEAMSCGTPVIASDVGGLPEALGPFAPEWVFPAGDTAALLRLIERVEDEAPARDLLLAHAAANSWERCALSMEARFAELCR
ncbi:glycosyltransferase family 4 protein [Actinopolymorpha pittospori]